MKKKLKWFACGLYTVVTTAGALVLTCVSMYFAFTATKGWEAILFFIEGVLGLVATVLGSALIGRNDEFAHEYIKKRRVEHDTSTTV